VSGTKIEHQPVEEATSEVSKVRDGDHKIEFII
jgi:hypothetical protein